ncbi:hypothetical protein TIFTF001_036102 [Ficus carica]|uniref:AAA+ ATPase domain-containing protein n=1 Tax=Ficus carica TaxID=3494 RepID=A0AA88E3L3_FICCA|nr:hypothetical protein TIFTF001_036102 [Ficus carica]
MVSLDKQLEELKVRKRDVESKVAAQHVLNETELMEEVKHWLEKVENIEGEVMTIKEKVKNVKFFSCASLSKDVVKKIGEVKDLIDERSTFPERLVFSCSNHGHVMAPQVLEGTTFEKKREEIWARLINNEVTRIGVHGMGGSGKTTVLKQINDRLLESKDKFDNVIWATVSKDSDVLSLQYKLARMLELDLSYDDGEARASKLRTRLEAKKRFVLILDDLWEPLNSLHDIGIPEPTHQNGCKLMLTTRSRDVCRKMSCEPIEMELLSQTEALDLFLEKVGREVSSVPSLKEVVDRIVKECARLPLAIVTIAGSLKGSVDHDEWVVALEELREATKGSASDGIMEKLKFSYDRLSNQLQACLLYCTLFPEDHEIQRDLLIEQLTVEGIIPKMSTRELEIKKGQVMLNNLENVSLLNGIITEGVKYVKMHDLIRDMTLQIVSESPRYLVKAGVGLKSVPTEESIWKVDIAKASLISNNISDILPDTISPNCPTLSTLLMSRNSGLGSISDNFFLHFKALNVLDLSDNPGLKNLPDSISDLVTLGALFLRNCLKLRCVPSLARLKDLKKLDLFSSGIDQVPHGLEMLVKLTYLNFCGCPLKNIPDGILCKLTNLQFLALSHTSEGPTMKGEELADLRKMENFEGVLCDSESFNEYVTSLGEKGPARYLLQLGFSDSYVHYASEESGDKIVYLTSNWQQSSSVTLLLPKDVKMLAIRHVLGTMSSLCELTSDYNAAKLRVCYIEDCSAIRYLFCNSDSGVPLLPSLDILHLDGVKDLWGLIERKIASEASSQLPPAGSFLSLKELRICDCNSIKKLFGIDITSLPNLEQLTLSRCEQLEAIVSMRSDDEEHQAEGEITEHAISTISLPKLRRLVMSTLPKLHHIPVIADSLQEIHIDACPKLERISFLDRESCPPNLLHVDIDQSMWSLLKWDYPNAKDVVWSLMNVAYDVAK